MATLLGPQDSANFAQAQWQSMFAGLFSNGVIQGQLNSYSTTTTSGLGISVASGRAMIQGFMAQSDAAVALTAATADPTNPRIDRAVLHADLSAHTLAVQLLTGSPASSPTPPALTQTSTVWEISLYQVRVNAGATSITSLTDERTYSLATTPTGSIIGAMLASGTIPDGAMANPKVSKVGDTMTGMLTTQVTLGGSARGIATWTATDGKSYEWFINTDNSVSLYNATDNVTVFKVFPTGAISSAQGSFWNSGNDGAGSGLDADLLDGLNSTAFPIVGTHSAGQPKISYGAGAPATLDANEIYFQLS